MIDEDEKENKMNTRTIFSCIQAVDWWLEDMYLANPLPLPINSNPAFVLPQQHFINTNAYLR
jgi:hypothetical protein